MGSCKTKVVREIETEKVQPPPAYDETQIDDKRLSVYVAAKDVKAIKAFLCDLTHFEELYVEKNELEVARAWTLTGVSGDEMAALYNAAYTATTFPSHKRAALTLHKIGECVRDCGHINQSIQFFERALVIMTIEFGAESTEVATTLNSLGRSYTRLGQLGKCKDVWSRALEIRRKLAPLEGNQDLAISLNNWGLLLHDLNDFRPAEIMLMESLDMYTRVLGLCHKDTAIAHHNLALLYDKIDGRRGEAIEHCARALTIKEILYGPDHDILAMTLNNLGLVYDHHALHQKARELYLRAIEIKEKTFGPDHLDVSLFCFNVGSNAGITGNLEEAKVYLTRSLKIRRAVFGADHALTGKVVALFNLFSLPVPE